MNPSIFIPDPINGKWSNWGPFGSCSKTCGGGTRTRRRWCNNPPPSNGGDWCVGASVQSARCNVNACRKFSKTPTHGYKNWHFDCEHDIAWNRGEDSWCGTPVQVAVSPRYPSVLVMWKITISRLLLFSTKRNRDLSGADTKVASWTEKGKVVIGSSSFLPRTSLQRLPSLPLLVIT